MEAKTFAPGSRIGILGGTFDPIHNGHLALAEAVRTACRLDTVIFIPAGTPPHKRGERTPGELRCRMVELAIAGKPYFQVSRLEVEREGPSYTVTTLHELHTLNPGVELFLILGADMAVDFPHWRDPAGILSLAHLVAVSRPGVGLGEDELRALIAQPAYREISLVEIPGVDLSSTEIRERVRSGLHIADLTPTAVAEFIIQRQLYQGK